MRVAFDMTPAVSGETGIAVYVRELSAALERRGVDVVRFSLGRRVRPVPPGSRHLPVPLRALHRSWSTLGWPRAEQLTGPVDLVHASGPVPVPSRHPVVAVVYDLAAIDHEHLHGGRAARELRRTLGALHRAAEVVTISDATRDRLLAHGLPPHRVTTTPLGRRELPPPDARLLPRGRFVLAVGQLVPRKRLDVLVRATPSLPADVSVVLCGPDGGERADLERLASGLGVSDRILFTGWASGGELAALYGAADAVVACSVDEGFGLPVLEAMAAGAPVVATDVPAFRELGGDALTYVPVGDPAALAAAVRSVVDDDGERGRRAAAGVARAAGRTWAACADATVDVYARALAGMARSAG